MHLTLYVVLILNTPLRHNAGIFRREHNLLSLHVRSRRVAIGTLRGNLYLARLGPRATSRNNALHGAYL